MILSCNSCEKKFVVPDNAITSAGRVVQCGSCGNKWKQFPLAADGKASAKKIQSPRKVINQKVKKSKKTSSKKMREINLYSPEYLAKKHGIRLNDTMPQKKKNETKVSKVSFGFYNSLILFIFLVISISRILYFAQEYIVTIFPISEFYLNYFFESIRNIFEIWKNLITDY